MRPLNEKEFAQLNAAVGQALAEVGFVQDGKGACRRGDMKGKAR